MLMSPFEQKYGERITSIFAMTGEARLSGLSEIARLAETESDADAAGYFHHQVIEIASHENRLDYELRSFHELRRLYASGPQYDHLRETILWYFKWITERLPEHADVSRELIDATFDQMEQFYQSERESLRPVHALRCRTAAFMSREEESIRYFDLWQTTPAGKSDDCKACEVHALVQYYLDVERADDAIRTAAPVIEGKMHCEEVPATTFSRLLVPLLQKGMAGLAEEMRLFVARQVRKTPKLVSYFANHVVFLCLTGRSIPAHRSASLLLARGTCVSNTFDQYAAWRAGWVWLRFLNLDGCVKVKLPRSFDPESAGVPIDTLTAADRCRREALALSIRFDARNGTDRFARSMASLDEFFETIRKEK